MRFGFAAVAFKPCSLVSMWQCPVFWCFSQAFLTVFSNLISFALIFNLYFSEVPVCVMKQSSAFSCSPGFGSLTSAVLLAYFLVGCGAHLPTDFWKKKSKPFLRLSF